jgi:hypothetical protein
MKEFVVEQILDGYLITAFPIAIIAGVISFLSPCVLPLVPGYISYAAGFSKSRGRVLLGSILFVLGFSVFFISYGALFGGFGAYVFDNEKDNYFCLRSIHNSFGIDLYRCISIFAYVSCKDASGLLDYSAHQYLDFYSELVGHRASDQHSAQCRHLHFKNPVHCVEQYCHSVIASV